jgi:SAM-dependent methyltransferase
MKCRHCQAEVTLSFIDLGTAPPSNAYLTAAQLDEPEKWYPLRVLTCTECWLVQTQDYAHFDELFSNDYAYFSSYSDSWLRHARDYVAAMSRRFELGPSSRVVEVAANDGYLLQFVRELGIPCLGIEPTASTARAARARHIEIREEFFGVESAERLVRDGWSADLMAANNVLAHVPDINDFVAGFARALKPTGVATFEFPHLMKLVADCQFDTIYHEHFSYLSLTAVAKVFERNGLVPFDVETLPTHGGSLRVFAQRADDGQRALCGSVQALLALEKAAGVSTANYYADFQTRAADVKNGLLAFLIAARQRGDRVLGYGAAAKGNTLLNYAGVGSDLLPCVVDRSHAKQGKYMPGSRIPIVAEDRLKQARPDYVVILPWNLRDEIEDQLSYVRSWGGRFVTAVPTLTIE